jgi:hypothetical protein
MNKVEFLELLKDQEVVDAIRKSVLIKKRVAVKCSEFKPYVGDWVVNAGALLKTLILSDTRFHNRWFKSAEVYNAVLMDRNYLGLEGVLHTGRGLRFLADGGLLKVSTAGKGLMKFRYDTGIND